MGFPYHWKYRGDRENDMGRNENSKIMSERRKWKERVQRFSQSDDTIERLSTASESSPPQSADHCSIPDTDTETPFVMQKGLNKWAFPFVSYEKVSDLRLLHASQVAGAKLGRLEKCDGTARKRRNTPLRISQWVRLWKSESQRWGLYHFCSNRVQASFTIWLFYMKLLRT